MIDFQKDSRPTARKEHKCDLCGGMIKIGEKYIRCNGMYDGEFFDSKHHVDCMGIIEKYCRAHEDNEYTADAIEDWIWDRVCADCVHGSEDYDGYTPCPHKTPFECPEVRERMEVE